MTLLILNRRPIVENIPDWLAEFDRPLVLITARSAVTPETVARIRCRYSRIEIIDDYDDPTVEAFIQSTAQRHNAGRILSTTETDVLRAARVREKLDLPGQSVASALAFRDKYVMKNFAKKAGLGVPHMQRFITLADLRGFCESHGFPVVVKPATGGGSVGVHILADRARAEAFASHIGRSQEDFKSQELILESWIEGDFYTIDGLMAGGNVLQSWPSRTTANLSAVLGPMPLISWMLLKEDPVGSRLNKFVAAVIKALPSTEEITAFHAEVFHTPDDRMFLCEIACRPGGCGHVPVYERGLGVNLYAASLRGQAGCTIPPNDLTGKLNHLAGFGWFPPRAGVLRRLPQTCPVAGVYSYVTSGKEGQSYHAAHAVADNIARALVSGPAENNLKPRLDALEDWWRQACVWQPAPNGSGADPG